MKRDASLADQTRQRLRGLICTCPPHCTDEKWGDGPRDCEPECKPCRIMRGRNYQPY